MNQIWSDNKMKSSKQTQVKSLHSLKPPSDDPLPSSPTSKDKDVAARILKKRESDRRCQRVKRERTKSKIAALEERVRSFGNQDQTGQVQMLMQHVQDVERERDQLAKKVKTIENVIRDAGTDGVGERRLSATQENPVSWFNSPGESITPEYSNINRATSMPRGRGTSDSPSAMAEGERSFGVEGVNPQSNRPVPDMSSFMMADGQGSATIVPEPSEPSDNTAVLHVQPASGPIPRPSPDRQPETKAESETKLRTDELLTSWFDWPGYFQLLQDTYRDDIPIRAIVEGWDAIDTLGPVHPSWQIVRKVDQILFKNSTPEARLGILYVAQKLLLSHITSQLPTDLPEFYTKRPSQDMASSYATHFFPWPGLRERLVFGQHRYGNRDFWTEFPIAMRIRWPFEFRDCYNRNVETGRYSVSPLFQARVKDIRSWTMEADFFIKWPELRSDIPVYNSIPGSVSNVAARPQFRTYSERARHMQKEAHAKQAASPGHHHHHQTLGVYGQPESIMTASYPPQAFAYSLPQEMITNMNAAQSNPQLIPENLNYYDPGSTPMDPIVDF